MASLLEFYVLVLDQFVHLEFPVMRLLSFETRISLAAKAGILVVFVVLLVCLVFSFVGVNREKNQELHAFSKMTRWPCFLVLKR